jgi:hypothetical protein
LIDLLLKSAFVEDHGRFANLNSGRILFSKTSIPGFRSLVMLADGAQHLHGHSDSVTISIEMLGNKSLSRDKSHVANQPFVTEQINCYVISCRRGTSLVTDMIGFVHFDV